MQRYVRGAFQSRCLRLYGLQRGCERDTQSCRLAMVWLTFTAVGAPAVPLPLVSQTIPYFDTDVVVIEGENFTAATPASQWVPKAWGEDGGLFASTDGGGLPRPLLASTEGERVS